MDNPIAPPPPNNDPPAIPAPVVKPRRRGLWIALAIVGFLVVCGVVAAVLVAVGVSKFNDTAQIRQSVAVRSDIQAITSHLRLYESMNGFLPTTDQGLQALVVQPTTDPRPTRWVQSFHKLPEDPWHSQYIYRQPGRKKPDSFDLFSAGPDRAPDTADDLWGD